ncbi:hypothetical protein [Flavihumibacter fluvii]|uniref:hypothetical protein n=1 Tax=Flavihumibacter fluvii TaxID=2838157 RepID=UPI001BDF6727|nr:hypothetical protein [Flavihumibacter fluvii]ULQ52007.1 hypothetical protein KJS93_18100 [Flavihumibacter fluvii]
MKIKFPGNVIVSLSICLVLGCAKDYSYEGKAVGNPTAVFNIAITETDCAAITLHGQYRQNIALTANETVSVEVDVIQAGQWAFSTTTVNGFSFSGSGNISNTGKQNIVLNGAGTPLSPGNYRFALTDTSAVTFLISVLKQDVAEEAVEQTSYFKATIGGVAYNFDAALPGPDDIPYGYGGGDTASFASFLVGGTYPSIPGPGVVSLQKNYLYNYYGSTEADFKNFFTPGAYAYVSPGSCNITDMTPGILLYWAETGGDVWGTRDGPGNQEGSSFTIVGIEDGHNTAGNYYVKVKTRFNCILYNLTNGESRALTNGEMVSYFIKP